MTDKGFGWRGWELIAEAGWGGAGVFLPDIVCASHGSILNPSAKRNIGNRFSRWPKLKHYAVSDGNRVVPTKDQRPTTHGEETFLKQ